MRVIAKENNILWFWLNIIHKFIHRKKLWLTSKVVAFTLPSKSKANHTMTIDAEVKLNNNSNPLQCMRVINVDRAALLFLSPF